MHGLSVMRLSRLVRGNVDRQLSPSGRSGEAGTVAVIFGMLLAFGVLLGLGALVIDTGSLLYERRQLQSGADAASLSLAKTCAQVPLSAPCAAPDYSPGSTLTGLAGKNAADQLSNISSVCGSAAVVAADSTGSWTPCPDWLSASPPPDPGLIDCPRTFSTGKYVEVQTSTRTASDGNILPPILAQLLAGGTYSGETVKACARAGWGAPLSVISAIPVTISQCEFNAFTTSGTVFYPEGPVAPLPAPSPTGFPYEKAILFHTEGGTVTCPQGPSGAEAPGGFGYLQTTGCNATVSATDTATVLPGNPNNTALGCDFTPLLSATTGQPVFVPIYTDISGGNYTLDGVAAFWLTGFSTSGNRHVSDASGLDLCSNSQTCLYGWFTSDIDTSGSFGGGGGGTPRGAIEVGVTG
jgi:hypothetical protein